jgi:hypothetical protein
MGDDQHGLVEFLSQFLKLIKDNIGVFLIQVTRGFIPLLGVAIS